MKIRCLCVLFLALSAYGHMPSSFTRDVFLQTWAVNEKNPNIVVSPYSLIAPLGTLALASEGTSQEQILKALHVKTTSQVSEMYTTCTDHIRNVGDVVINTSNRLYVSDREELLPEFNSAAKHMYDVGVKSIDFSVPEKTAKQINHWVAKKTKNRIKKLIDPSTLQPTTTAVLVNAIYFDGKWKKRFHYSVKRKFYAYESTMMVPTMKVDAMLEYGYNEELDAEVVSIPYKDEKCFFVVVLPNNKTKVDTLKTKLKRNNEAVNNALKELSETNIRLSMPVFEFETQTDLKIVLEKLNIKDIFSPSKAKLTGMMKKDSKLFIQGATQKAYIKVNEEGTQAAAANAFVIHYMYNISPKKEVAVDRPFYFEIRCSAITLFNGIVRKP